MLQKNQKCEKKTPPKHPRAPKRRPRPSQTPPKWSPRPPQNWFLSNFLQFVFQCQIYIDFLSIFCRFLVIFLKVEPLILVLPSRRNAIFHKIAFFDNNQKNHRKNPPKTLPKPPKIDPKSQKIAKNLQKYTRWLEMRQKIEKNCEKVDDDSRKFTMNHLYY